MLLIKLLRFIYSLLSALFVFWLSLSPLLQWLLLQLLLSAFLKVICLLSSAFHSYCYIVLYCFHFTIISLYPREKHSPLPSIATEEASRKSPFSWTRNKTKTKILSIMSSVTSQARENTKPRSSPASEFHEKRRAKNEASFVVHGLFVFQL